MERAPRVSPEEVKRRMDEGEDMVVLDMRRGSWHRSDVMMKGARRVELMEVLNGLRDFPRDVPIVTYCT